MVQSILVNGIKTNGVTFYHKLLPLTPEKRLIQ